MKPDMPYFVARAILLEWSKRHPGQSSTAHPIVKENPELAPGVVPLDGRPLDPDTTILVIRIADYPADARPEAGSRVAPCTRCGALCWLAPSTPRAIHGEIMCMQCAATECLRDMILGKGEGWAS